MHVTVRSALTKCLVFALPGHSEDAGGKWPKLCTAKGPPDPRVLVWFEMTLETDHWLINHLRKCWDPVILLDRFFYSCENYFKRYFLHFSVSSLNVRIYNSKNNGKPAVVWRMFSAFLIKIYNPVVLASWNSVKTVITKEQKDMHSFWICVS